MIDLKDYINESLLDDFDDIAQAQDDLFSDPLNWIYKKSKNCKNWNQLIKILKEFKEFIDASGAGTIIKRRTIAPKTGIYSRMWDLRIYNFGKSNMLCRFEIDLDDIKNDKESDLCVLIIGFGKIGRGIMLCFDTTGAYWKMGINVTQKLVSNNSSVYHIDPKSTFYKGYDDLLKKINK